MIHVAVSQLRKVLPAGALQTRAPGYVLQRASRDGPASASSELRAAGRLRRRPRRCGAARRSPSSPSRSRRREGARLEDLRLERLEDRIDADLAARRARRARGRARGARRRAPAARASAASAHARAVPLRPPGRGARRLPRLPRRRSTRARHRAVGRAARARALDAAPGGVACAAPAVARRRAAPCTTSLSGDVSIAYQVVGRRPAGHRARPRLGVQLPPGLGAARHRALLRAARRDGAPDPLRQARHRPVGSRRRASRRSRSAWTTCARSSTPSAPSARRCSASRRAAPCPRCSPRRTRRAPRRWWSWVTFARRRPGPDYPIDVPPVRLHAARSGACPPRGGSSPSARRRSPTTRRRSAGTAPTSCAARSPGAAPQMMRMNLEIDVRHVLPAIQAPSLVLYREGEYLREATRYMGGLLPRARASARCPAPTTFRGRATRSDVLREIEAFLAAARARTASPTGCSPPCCTPGRPTRATALLRGHLGRFRGDRAARGRRRAARELRRPGPRDPLRARRSSSTRARSASRQRRGLHTGECEVAATSALRGPALELADGVARPRRPARCSCPRPCAISSPARACEFAERGTVRLPAGGASGRLAAVRGARRVDYRAVTGRLAGGYRPPVHSALQAIARRAPCR